MLIQLSLDINDELAIKSVSFTYNDTDLPSDSKTLAAIAKTILHAIKINKDKLLVDDTLYELGIKKSKE